MGLLMLTLLPRLRPLKVSSRLPEREAESVDLVDETRPAQTKENVTLIRRIVSPRNLFRLARRASS